jgi:hypothetical protein
MIQAPPFNINMWCDNCAYLCQSILLFWRQIYVSEEKSVVLEEDKIRECSRVKESFFFFVFIRAERSGERWITVPCRAADEFEQNRKRIDCPDQRR